MSKPSRKGAPDSGRKDQKNRKITPKEVDRMKKVTKLIKDKPAKNYEVKMSFWL